MRLPESDVPASMLAGCTALVTGAGSGLGAAIARALHADGANVVLADLAVMKASQVAARMDPEARRCCVVHCDVREPESARCAVDAAIARFGTLDALVNNAGFDVTKCVEDLSVQEWDAVLDTNLRGPFLLTKAALPALRAGDGGRGGHIVNITSTAARRAWPNAAAYHASKWGLTGFSHALHAELRGGGVRVTNIVAGGMRTPFLLDRFPDIDASRLQDPERVADGVCFALRMPRDSVVAELMILPLKESSWP